MSNLTDCVAVLAALDAQGKCPTAADLTAKLSAPAAGEVKLPPGCALANIPGLPGLVYLTGLPAGSYWATVARAIDEVGQCYPDGSTERNNINLQVSYANEWTEIDGFPWTTDCYAVAYKADGTPYLDTRKAVMGTEAEPSKDRNGAAIWGATVASATAHFASMPNPVASSGAGFGAGNH